MPIDLQAMEHGGTLTARACMLDGDTAKRVRFHRCYEADDMGQGAVGWLRRRGLNISLQEAVGSR